METSRVGSIAVVDLEALARLRGDYSLPYPLGRSRPVGSAWLLGLDEAPLADRLNGGDPAVFRDWLESCASADIWVECRVNYTCADEPDTRIHAFRSGRSAFLAKQRPDEKLVDVVEISSLSMEDLGSVVAASVGLTKPGAHARIVVPRFSRSSSTELRDSDEDFSVSIRDIAPDDSAPIVVDDVRVTAMGALQSRCDETARWGVDETKDVVAWVYIEDDGDYVFSPDFSIAIPLGVDMLEKRINGLIASDVAALRQRRAENRPI